MKLSVLVTRLLIGKDASPERLAEVDQAIERENARTRQNTQSLQSGARVLHNMSGMIRMMTEAENGTHR